MIGYIGVYCQSNCCLITYKVFAGIGVLLDIVMIFMTGADIQYIYSCGNLVLYILLFCNNIFAIDITSKYQKNQILNIVPNE